MGTYNSWFPPYGDPFHSSVLRPAYRGGSSAPAWTPADLFVGSVGGFCLDGSPGGSLFYEEDTKTTLATANESDPLGCVTDVSGNGLDYAQASSPSRCVYCEDAGGIRSIRLSTVSGVNRWLSPTTPIYGTPVATTVVVYAWFNHGPTSSGALLSNYEGAWGTGGYYQVAPDSPDSITFYCNTFASAAAVAGVVPNTAPVVGAIALAEKRGTGTDAYLTAYSLAGTLIGASAAGNSNITATSNQLHIGNATAGYNSIQSSLAFMLHIEKELSAGEKTNLLSYLTEKFSGWVPGTVIA